VILVSPWCDFKLSSDGQFKSYETEKGWDMMSVPRLRGAVKSAIRWYNPEVVDGVWFSPSRCEKGDWTFLEKEGVKVYVHYGRREIFRDEILHLINGMKADGVDVTVREVSVCIW